MFDFAEFGTDFAHVLSDVPQTLKFKCKLRLSQVKVTA